MSCAGGTRRRSSAWPGSAKPFDPGPPPHIDLDLDTASAEWAVGQSLTLEQLVSYALSDAD